MRDRTNTDVTDITANTANDEKTGGNFRPFFVFIAENIFYGINSTVFFYFYISELNKIIDFIVFICYNQIKSKEVSDCDTAHEIFGKNFAVYRSTDDQSYYRGATQR